MVARTTFAGGVPTRAKYEHKPRNSVIVNRRPRARSKLAFNVRQKRQKINDRKGSA